MKISITSLFSLLTFIGMTGNSVAQCILLDDAVAGISLATSSDGTDNRSGIAYDPGLQLYHSVNAGNSGYPLDTYNAAGTLVNTTAQGFDYRGAWWNPMSAQCEGNGYASGGLFIQTLEAGTGYPLGIGTTIPFGQPNEQSNGDLDTDAQEVIYYHDGEIHRYSRATGASLGALAITGVPNFSSINNNSVAYTGCPGHEYGIYDYSALRFILIDKANGQVSGSCQLPPSAPARSSFGMSYANNKLWLFESNAWTSYTIFSFSVGEQEVAEIPDISIYPMPAEGQVTMAFGEVLNASVVMQMIDMAGSLVRKDLIPQGSRAHTMDVGALPSGAYHIRLITAAGITTRPLLITR